MPTQPLTTPVKRVPCADGTDYLVDIVPMTVKHAKTWHRDIQPLVDRNYRHFGEIPNQTLAETRADKGWNWPRYLRWAQLYSYASMPSAFGMGWCVTLTGLADVPPLGMLTMAPNYHSTLNGVARDRSFAWYLSTAPGEFYQRLGIDDALGIAKVLLDTAIQTRKDVFNDYSLFLHADPKGGPALQQYYLKQGMTMVPGAASDRVSPLRRFKPQEYFEMDAPAARQFCAQLDAQR